MSAIGALAYRTDGCRSRVFVKLHRGEVRSEQVLSFLKHLLRHVRGRVVVVWDRLNAHRSVLVREWALTQSRLELVLLPAYAPELNPVEGLWAWTKGKLLANVCEDTLEPVVGRVRKGVDGLRRRERVLDGFLAKAGLSF